MEPLNRQLVIEPPKEGKGRTFRASLLAYVAADALWSGGAADVDSTRPVWMMLAGSDAELRAFVANLRTGHRADVSTENRWSRRAPARYEILRSAGYEFSWQRTPLGSAVTVYLPSLFCLDPGMVDPDGIKFCVLPPAEWLASQQLDVAGPMAHLRRLGCGFEDALLASLVPLSALFAAYLDRRTRCPLIPDPRFHAQLLCAALSKGIASFPESDHYYGDMPWGVHRGFGFKEEGTEVMGLAQAIACKVKHEDFETFLADQVSLYFATVGGIHGTA